jgi:hypothetical protein
MSLLFLFLFLLSIDCPFAPQASVSALGMLIQISGALEGVLRLDLLHLATPIFGDSCLHF